MSFTGTKRVIDLVDNTYDMVDLTYDLVETKTYEYEQDDEKYEDDEDIETTIDDFVYFVETVLMGYWEFHPIVETIRQKLQSKVTLSTCEKLMSVWKSGVEDGVICSFKIGFDQSGVESFNAFIVELSRNYGGQVGNVPTLKMFDASLDENVTQSFTESYSKGMSNEVPFVTFPGNTQEQENVFWIEFN